jgi:hypothetical protein
VPKIGKKTILPLGIIVTFIYPFKYTVFAPFYETVNYIYPKGKYERTYAAISLILFKI